MQLKRNDMPIHNSYISQVLDELADLLEIQGANPFRIRAYRNAARVITNWPQSLSYVLTRDKSLPKLPGLGPDLTNKVKEIILTGNLGLLIQEEKKTPKELITLLKLPGLGPKRVLLLRNQLGIRSLRDLKTAVLAGKLQKLRGFGPKIERNLLNEISGHDSQNQRILLAVAEQIAEPLIDYLRILPSVNEVVVAGSYRRKCDTVGDLDLLISGRDPSKIMEKFVQYDEVSRIISHGITRSSIFLRSEIQIDLRVISKSSFGAALHYFTGSKSHNIAIRTLGIKKGLKINEYGIFLNTKKCGGKTEQDVFQKVGLPYIEPELREARGEIEAAKNNRLPNLVQIEDILGDLHSHTQETDGKFSLEAMAEAAKKKGYHYLAITDHSKHLTVANGMSVQRLKKQIRAIDRFNSKLKGIYILKGIEVDILENGTLDLPNEILADLDLTVCSIHSKFDLNEEKQTERIIRAMDNPFFKILGHPTGRLINKRSPYALDIEKLLRAAKERGCFMEINSQPERMDLNDIYCKAAKELGVKLSISTDAHHQNDLNYMRFGVAQARRGWLEPSDIINTRNITQLKRILKRG